MAGVKRRTPYRKQVTDDALHSFPEPSDSQLIAKVVRSHGSNLLEASEIDVQISAGALCTPAGNRGGWRHCPCNDAHTLQKAIVDQAGRLRHSQWRRKGL